MFDQSYIAKKLYLAEVLTYGKINPIKIGISKDPYNRIYNLRSMGIRNPEFIGYFECSDKKPASVIEAEILRHFPVCPRYGQFSREILAASADELFDFIAKRKPLDFIKVSSQKYFWWEPR